MSVLKGILLDIDTRLMLFPFSILKTCCFLLDFRFPVRSEQLFKSFVICCFPQLLSRVYLRFQLLIILCPGVVSLHLSSLEFAKLTESINLYLSANLGIFLQIFVMYHLSIFFQYSNCNKYVRLFYTFHQGVKVLLLFFNTFSVLKIG